jgi:hypothetical protein
VLRLEQGLPKRRRKRLVNIMVGKPLGVAREFLLFRSNRERRKSLGSLPGAQIHDRLFAGGSSTAWVVQEREVPHRVARQPRKHQAQREKRQQKKKKDYPGAAQDSAAQSADGG